MVCFDSHGVPKWVLIGFTRGSYWESVASVSRGVPVGTSSCFGSRGFPVGVFFGSRGVPVGACPGSRGVPAGMYLRCECMSVCSLSCSCLVKSTSYLSFS